MSLEKGILRSTDLIRQSCLPSQRYMYCHPECINPIAHKKGKFYDIQHISNTLDLIQDHLGALCVCLIISGSSGVYGILSLR